MKTPALLPLLAVAALLTAVRSPAQTTSTASAPTAAGTSNATTVQMSAFEVEDVRTHEYRATNSMSASRLPMALSEVPFNIAIVTEDFILDTASFGGETTVDFSGGANREAVNWNASVNGKAVRGFNTLEFMRNGFLRYSDNGSATMERIEIIKGPTSVLDAVTEAGGVINVITKQPQPAKPFTRVRAAYGSFERYVATLDVNGKPLFTRADGKSLLSYRLVGSLEGSRGQSKHRQRKVENIMPSLLFQPTPKTNILFQWEYYFVDGERGNNIDGFARTVSVPAANGLTGDVPLSVLFGVDPYMSWDGPDHKQPEFVNDVLFQIEHRFTNNFVATFAMNNHNRNRRWGPQVINNGIFQAPAANAAPGAAGTAYNHAAANANPVMRRSWQNNVFDQEVAGIRGNFAYRLDALGATHRFVAGYLSQIEDQYTRTDPLRRPGALNVVAYEFFPVRDPNPDLRIPSNLVVSPGTTYGENHFEVISTYINHHARWLDGRLNTLWGLYRAENNTRNDSKNVADNTSRPGFLRTYKTTKVTPQFGTIFGVTKGINVYANYSKSVKGNPGSLDGFDRPFGPTQGQIYEVGSKVSLFRDRVIGTLSLYKIEENDRIINDPEAPNKDNPTADPNLPRGANVQVGQVVSEGFDADMHIYPIRNFTTVFSYAYNQRETTKDPVASRRGPLAGYKHKATMVNKYSWREGSLKGLSANVNVRYVWDQVRTTNRFGQPAYLATTPSLSLGLNYAMKVAGATYRFSAHAQNLLNNQRSSGYIPGTRNAYYLDNPKTYLASIDVEF
ncbi:MAG: TonB-dependent receptor [Opitutaceae bacterium]|nr:TonB-dependent receptor [Opitutaceae bacterium]